MSQGASLCLKAQCTIIMNCQPPPLLVLVPSKKGTQRLSLSALTFSSGPEDCSPAFSFHSILCYFCQLGSPALLSSRNTFC